MDFCCALNTLQNAMDNQNHLFTLPSSQFNYLYNLRGFIAGSVSGFAQSFIGQPFDTIKIRLQTSKQSISCMSCINDLIKKEGVLAFYKGISPPLTFNVFVVSLQFGVFESSKKFFAGFDNNYIPLQCSFMASITAGIACSFLLAPMELIKINQQLCQSKVCGSLIQTYQQICKANGFLGLFKGLKSTSIREIIGQSIYFVSYEASMQQLEKKSRKQLMNIAPLICGGLAGLLSWIFSYPIDTINSKIQSDNFINPQFKGIIDCYKKTVQQYGYKKLFKGLGVCSLRSIPTNSGGFYIYEHCVNQIESRYQYQF